VKVVEGAVLEKAFNLKIMTSRYRYRVTYIPSIGRKDLQVRHKSGTYKKILGFVSVKGSFSRDIQKYWLKQKLIKIE
jgi:hypothetical protein